MNKQEWLRQEVYKVGGFLWGSTYGLQFLENGDINLGVDANFNIEDIEKLYELIKQYKEME